MNVNVNLENKEKRASLNLNFTAFFSVKGTDYRTMLKQMIDFYGCSIEEVNSWFEEALNNYEQGKVLVKNSSRETLEKNYEYFKKTYLKDKVTSKSSIISKIENFKYTSLDNAKDTLKKLYKLEDDLILMNTDKVILIYKGLGNIDIGVEKLKDDTIFKRDADNLVELVTTAKYLGTYQGRELKKISNVAYLEHNDKFFDIKCAFSIFDSKADIDVLWMDKLRYVSDLLILKQTNASGTITMVISKSSVEDTGDVATYAV